jgi:hypothetical protein
LPESKQQLCRQQPASNGTAQFRTDSAAPHPKYNVARLYSEISGLGARIQKLISTKESGGDQSCTMHCGLRKHGDFLITECAIFSLTEEENGTPREPRFSQL